MRSAMTEKNMKTYVHVTLEDEAEEEYGEEWLEIYDEKFGNE